VLKSLNMLNLFAHADAKKFASGDVVFREEDPGDAMYIVKSGKVVLKAGERAFETLSAGAIFGEMALIDNEKRSASATASGECELIVIDEKRFNFLVQETPYFAQHVMRVMANRLRQMNKQAK